MAENFKVPPMPTAPKTTPSTQTVSRGAVPPRPTGINTSQQAPVRKAPLSAPSTMTPKPHSSRAPQMTQAPRQPMRAPQMRQQPVGSVSQQTRAPMPAQSSLPRQTAQQSAPAVSQQSQPLQQPQPAQTQTQQASTQSQQLPEGNFAEYYGLPDWILGPKALPALAFGVCIIGFLMGYMLFSKPNRPMPRNNGAPQWVVRNTDLSKPYPRCGRVPRGRACVLYIMNHTEYDKKAQSFFDEANRLTGVSQHHIELTNPTYAKTLIPGGYLAEIKIPDLM